MKRIWKFFDTNTSTAIVLVSYLIVLAFTIAVMILSAFNITIQDTLVEWFYKFFGLELVALSGIKISHKIGSAFGTFEDAVSGVLNSEEAAEFMTDDEEEE